MRSLRRGLTSGFAVLLLALPAAALEPGERVHVDPDALPAPEDAGESVANPPKRVAKPERVPLDVPDGFTANVFAGDLRHARNMVVAPDGTVFLAEPRAGRVLRLVDRNGDGRAETRTVYTDGYDTPHGLALHRGHLLVADLTGLFRVPFEAGAAEAPAAPERLTPKGAFGGHGGHWTRNIAVHPDGKRVYVAIGSRGNIAEEAPPRATVQEFVLDWDAGKTVKQSTFVAGTRNPVGIAFRPGTHELYTTVNERDGMGDALVPDYLARLERGQFYGWPYAYLGGRPQPGYAERAPEKVAQTVMPPTLFRAHAAALGVAFYDHTAFPERYHGDLFVALHGSWNAADPRGYAVVRVPFTGDGPQNAYTAFATGFRLPRTGGGGEPARVWGRPADVAVAADGSLLIADDVSQTVWRVAPAP